MTHPVEQLMAEKHTYPDKYRPGTHWASDEAWKILDVLPVGTLTIEQRAFIAGMISGALMRVAKEGAPNKGDVMEEAR